MENKFSNVLNAVENKEILAVIQGLPVDANGFFLTEEQLEAIDAALDANEVNYAGALGQAVEMEAEVSRLKAQLDEATAAANTANEQLQAAQARITELEATGAAPVATAKAEDEFEKPTIKNYVTSFDKLLLQ